MPHLGNYTKTDLRQLDWYEQCNQGQLNRQAARFGLELAQTAYDFDLGPWLSAGWTDVTIQVDDRLIGGVRAREEVSDWRQAIMNLVLPRLAKGLTALSNPLSELRSVTSLRFEKETGKAIVLMRAEEDGRFTVAIGFMGTGKRPQDWAGNMRFNQIDHFHEGFSAIAAQFEQNAADIHFPVAAAALGREDLTLKEVLAFCGQPGSPFRLLLAGHSQGAAVMQVWAYRQLLSGVLPENLLGLGFASPVVSHDLPRDEAVCPLTHFLVSDDIFTRVGLSDHLGACYVLRVDDAFRQVCYGKYKDDPLFLSTVALFNELTDTQTGLLFCQAYLNALSQQALKAIGASLAVFVDYAWVEHLAELPVIPDEWIERVMKLTLRGFQKFYYDATGQRVNPEDLSLMRDKVSRLMASYGAVEFSQMLVKTLHLTHSLVGKEPGEEDHAPYSYLVVRAFDQLEKVPEKPNPLVKDETAFS